MQHDNILNNLINNLNWNLPLNRQIEAIDSIILMFNQDNIDLYELFEKLGKNSWLNYCQIVKQISYPQNKSAIPALLFLLQDLNWPGSAEAMEILLSIQKEALIPYIQNSIKEAYSDNDFMWLGGLKILVNRLGLTQTDFDDIQLNKLLSLADF